VHVCTVTQKVIFTELKKKEKTANSRECVDTARVNGRLQLELLDEALMLHSSHRVFGENQFEVDRLVRVIFPIVFNDAVLSEFIQEALEE
jgi:hypothetical protein